MTTSCQEKVKCDPSGVKLPFDGELDIISYSGLAIYSFTGNSDVSEYDTVITGLDEITKIIQLALLIRNSLASKFDTAIPYKTFRLMLHLEI